MIKFTKFELEQKATWQLVSLAFEALRERSKFGTETPSSDYQLGYLVSLVQGLATSHDRGEEGSRRILIGAVLELQYLTKYSAQKVA
jgi:hypothetical protein